MRNTIRILRHWAQHDRRAGALQPTAPPPVRTARSRRRRASLDADRRRGTADQGRQVHRRARLARDERIHQRRQPGRQGRIQAARHQVVAQTDAGFDAARQKSDVETVLAKKPSIILSLPVDPASAAPVYDPARAAGVKLAFVDNAPAGYVHGKDYVTIVSDDLFQMGNKAAHRHGRCARQEGQGRLHLPRRRLLRHEPARRRLQGDDRAGLS